MVAAAEAFAVEGEGCAEEAAEGEVLEGGLFGGVFGIRGRA